MKFLSNFFKKPKIGYMCKTDFEYEVGNSDGYCKIFSSIESLKKHKKCWPDCGIIMIKLIIIN